MKKILLLTSALLSVLLISQSANIALAAGKRASLTFESSTITGSIAYPERNILSIKNAGGISSVTISPAKGTPASIRSISLGVVDGKVDLSALGRIPSGAYNVKAKKGSRILKGKFDFISPTILAGKLYCRQEA